MREKQHQHGSADVVHQVFRINQAAHQVVIVFHEGEVGDHLPGRGVSQQGAESGQQPGHEQKSEAGKGRHNLIFGDGGGKEADGQKQSTEQREPKITREHRIPSEIAEEGQGERNQGSEQQHPDEDEIDADKLPHDYFADPYRGGHQEFKGPKLALFGQQSHGEDGEDQEEDEPRAGKQVAKNQIVEIDLCRAALHLRQLDGLGSGKHNIEVGEETEGQEEHSAHHVDDRRNKIGAQFFSDDRLDGWHRLVSLAHGGVVRLRQFVFLLGQFQEDIF